MRLLLISDTHGELDLVRPTLKAAGKIDALIHLGDICGDESILQSMARCPFYLVAGNNDSWLSAPGELLIELAGKKVLMTHGDRLGVSYGLERLKFYALEKGAEVVMFGHTHVPLLDTSGNPWFMNPGSLSRPRTAGFSFITVDVDDAGIWHPELKYLHEFE